MMIPLDKQATRVASMMTWIRESKRPAVTHKVINQVDNGLVATNLVRVAPDKVADRETRAAKVIWDRNVSNFLLLSAFCTMTVLDCHRAFLVFGLPD
jgi:hypothetical protein